MMRFTSGAYLARGVAAQLRGAHPLPRAEAVQWRELAGPEGARGARNFTSTIRPTLGSYRQNRGRATGRMYGPSPTSRQAQSFYS